ncbi:YopX family protein [Secundilactobacillus collinoides]|nr:YopX family protein [Secundilactobacillus collinoides]
MDIKFRAWDINEKRMLKVYRLSFDGPIEGTQVHCYLDDRGSKGSKEYSYDGDGLILEQYTGLKDANGKEIYEGDILATSSVICGSSVTDYITPEWREEYAGFFWGEKQFYACLGEWDNEIKYPQTFPEIIGNVHENPELLEEQHER